MIELTLYGNPIVKKNTANTVWTTGRDGRKKRVRYYTANFNNWLEDAIIQLRNYRKIKPKEPIDYPVICKFIFYRKRDGVVDLSNLYEGVQDLLVKEGWLKDDESRILIGHDGSRVYVDSKRPRIEVSIIKAEV